MPNFWKGIWVPLAPPYRMTSARMHVAPLGVFSLDTSSRREVTDCSREVEEPVSRILGVQVESYSDTPFLPASEAAASDVLS